MIVIPYIMQKFRHLADFFIKNILCFKICWRSCCWFLFCTDILLMRMKK